MKALRIHAGPLAYQHLAQHGLQPSDVGVVPAAAGGPKGLILGSLDRFLFGQWLPQSAQPVHLVGASIGAWRMATACLNDPVAALQRLEDAYVRQHYEVPPGKKRPPASQVSEQFGQNLQSFYAGRVDEVLQHPRYHLHVIAARGRHVLGREHPVATPLGYLGAFFSNTVHRKALGAWLERVVFSSPLGDGPAGAPLPAPLPFGTHDFRTRQVRLTPANFMDALQASCSIPFVLQAVHHIEGAPPGAYWDGGLTDYHMHLAYHQPQGAINNIAAGAHSESAAGRFDSQSAVGGSETSQGAGLVLYPHFQHQVVPGWLDKALRWRHKATPALDSMVVLSPDPQWVKTLPNAKLPDRQDFTHYGPDTAARSKAWLAATGAAQQLADELIQWLQRPDMGAVHRL